MRSLQSVVLLPFIASFAPACSSAASSSSTQQAAATAIVDLVNVSNAVLGAAGDTHPKRLAHLKGSVSVKTNCATSGSATISGTSSSYNLAFANCDDGGTTVNGSITYSGTSSTSGGVVTETVTISGGPLTVVDAEGSYTMAFENVTLTLVTSTSGGQETTTVSASGAITFDGETTSLNGVSVSATLSVDGGSRDGGTFPEAGTAFAGTTIATKQSAPSLIATDVNNVYWVDNVTPTQVFGTFAVMKMPKSGGAPVALTTLPKMTQPGALLGDGKSVYWTALQDDVGNSGEPGAVVKVSVGGGTPVTLASASSSTTFFDVLAIDGTDAYYWTEGTTIDLMRVPLGGGSTTRVASMGQPGTGAFPTFAGLALDDSDLYWSMYVDGKGTVAKAPKAGGAIVTLSKESLSGGAQYYGCAVDTANVYWLSAANATGYISALKVPLAGGTAVTLGKGPSNDDHGTMGPAVLPSGIAQAGSSLYWTNLQAVVKMPKTGGTPSTVALTPIQGQPDDFTADSTGVYWTVEGLSNDTGTVVKAPL